MIFSNIFDKRRREKTLKDEKSLKKINKPLYKRIKSVILKQSAPVAQLDRASASGVEGRGFDSRRVYQSNKICEKCKNQPCK